MSVFETVVGLEVHVELATKTKIFCSCPTDFGAEPNTQVCPVCMGMPGVLPVLNERAVELAIIAGLATGCEISAYSKTDRKNYFYPDLPKAYQISQYDIPLCHDGAVEIETDGGSKRIGVTRIHIEEDSGKLLHDREDATLIDYNRCGVPLIEIVSEPDIRSASEAVEYLKKLRSILRYTGVSDCKMNEGSFRCDVNLSVRRPGERMGIRTEIKNLNSFQSVARAIEYEANRQIALIEQGEVILQQTRRFDASTGRTHMLRRKETADDYRFFPEPDLAGIVVSDETVNRLKSEIPELPDARKRRYIKEFGLAPYDAEMLADDRAVAEWFELALKHTSHAKRLANLALGEMFRLLGEDEAPQISPESAAKIVEMAAEGRINGATAKRVFAEVWSSGADPEAVVRSQGLEQLVDEGELRRLALEVIAENPKMTADYRGGKTAAFGALMGRLMHKTDSRGEPQLMRKTLEQVLNDM